MNDRVKTELLAEAAGRAMVSVVAKACALITAEYEGKSYSFRADGWFNATEAAKRYGNDVHEWVRLPETKRYLAALERTYGKIPYVETSRARADRGGGTWLHPKLAVRFSRWLDVDFEIWCDMQIDKILRGELLDSVDDRLTTPADRIPLHMAVPYIYQRTGACFPKIYVAISAAAGADDFPSMTMVNFALVAPFLLRIKNEADTQADWDMLHISGKQLRGNAQLELTFAESACYNPIKEAL